METTRKRRWQFGLRGVLIVIGGIGAELAIMRALSTYRSATTGGIMGLLTMLATFYFLALPIGVAAGLIFRSWKTVVLGTVIVMGIWLGSLWLLVTVDEGIREWRRPRTVQPGFRIAPPPTPATKP